MANIILPKPITGIVSGISFTNGRGTGTLGRHARRYFESIGATITDEGGVRAPSAPIDVNQFAEPETETEAFIPLSKRRAVRGKIGRE